MLAVPLTNRIRLMLLGSHRSAPPVYSRFARVIQSPTRLSNTNKNRSPAASRRERHASTHAHNQINSIEPQRGGSGSGALICMTINALLRPRARARTRTCVTHVRVHALVYHPIHPPSPPPSHQFGARASAPRERSKYLPSITNFSCTMILERSRSARVHCMHFLCEFIAILFYMI